MPDNALVSRLLLNSRVAETNETSEIIYAIEKREIVDKFLATHK